MDLYTVCVFYGLTGMRGDWGFVLSVLLVPRFYAVLQNYVKYVDPPLGWGHVIFMPKYGHCDVNQVTWALCLILIGRENFCCAVIGRYPVEPPILLWHPRAKTQVV